MQLLVGLYKFDCAKSGFKLVGKVDKNIKYLVIDDIVTTGAIVRYASKVLIDSGAGRVWLAVLALQALD